MKRWIALAAGLGLAACGETAGVSSSDASPGADASDSGTPAVNGPRVEVGTGVDRFEPLTEGQEVELILGSQGTGRVGGYHIWGAARVEGMNPANIRVVFRVIRLPERQDRALFDQRFRMLIPAADGKHVVFALKPRLNDCCEVKGHDVIMHVQVEDSDGKIAADERRVHATDICPDGAGGDICP